VSVVTNSLRLRNFQVMGVSARERE
jgi:hypothetical protein